MCFRGRRKVALVYATSAYMWNKGMTPLVLNIGTELSGHPSFPDGFTHDREGYDDV
jgi:hypothetical protein